MCSGHDLLKLLVLISEAILLFVVAPVVGVILVGIVILVTIVVLVGGVKAALG
jgi:hypothetical protein